MIGATEHYVTEDLDEGPIIAQDVEAVSHADTPEALVQKGRDIERRVLARVVTLHLENRVLVNGPKTVVSRNRCQGGVSTMSTSGNELICNGKRVVVNRMERIFSSVAAPLRQLADTHAPRD